MEWRVPVAGGVILGILVVIWQFAAAALDATALFPLVATLIELVVIVGALFQTRSQHGYGQQVAAGSAIGAISLLFIGPGAVLVGAAGAEVVAGVLGTLITGVVIALLAAIPLRQRT